MKKRLLYVSLAALVGAASLTACVKNDESASVTNLRDAKTAQLKSIAEMNSAEAQAKLIMAKAEAAYKDAETAFKKAEAEQEQGKADIAKARLAADIEAAVKAAEQALLTAKTNYNNAWVAYQQSLANNPNPYLEALMKKYNDYLNNAIGATPPGLYALTTDWTNKKAGMLTLKAGLITAQQWQANQVIAYNKNIVQYEALLAAYKTIPQGDKAAAWKAYQESLAKESELQGGFEPVVNKVNAAMKTIEKAIEALNGNSGAGVKAGAYYAAAKLTQLPYQYVNYLGQQTPVNNSTVVAGAVTFASGGTWTTNRLYTIGVGNQTPFPIYTPSVTNRPFDSIAKVDFEVIDQKVVDLIAVQATAKTNYETALANAKTAAGGKVRAELVTAVAAAQSAYDAAAASNAADVAAKLTALNTAKLAVDTWDGTVSGPYNAYEAAKAELAAWKAWYAVLTTKANVDAYNAQVKAVEDAYIAYMPTKTAFDDRNQPLTVQQTLTSSLLSLYNGTIDGPTLVNGVQKQLDDEKAKLAEVAYDVQGTFSKEQAVAKQEQVVAAAELAVKETQKIVDDLKAKIDAEIKK